MRKTLAEIEAAAAAKVKARVARIAAERAAYRELAPGDALSTPPPATSWQCGLCDQIASNAPEAVRLPKHSPRCTQRARAIDRAAKCGRRQ